jgi:hypothetical protein
MFIASSSEGATLAKKIQKALGGKSLDVRVWSDPGIFELSETTIEILEDQLDRFDFSIVVLTPDDIVEFRKEESPAPRDNAILELGMFIGRIGRRRSFMLTPSGTRLKLPTDLAGVTSARYKIKGKGKKTEYGIDDAVAKIQRAIKKAPPTPADTLLSTFLFPEVVLRYSYRLFEKYLKQGIAPSFKTDAQITVLGKDGTIVSHTSSSSVGHNACDHEGKILWTSFPTKEINHPFAALVRTWRKKGWVLWTDAGYSLLYGPIRSRSNERLCVARFARRADKIHVLELHQELSAPISEGHLGRVGRIVTERLKKIG